jgi:hypothetical protein
MIAADLLKWEKVKRSSQIPSMQALILVDLLGGDTVTWQLASVMFPTGRDTKSKELAGSFTYIHIQARVLYIEMFQRTLQGAADTLVRLIHSGYRLDCQAHGSSCTCYLLHFHHHRFHRTPYAHASVVAGKEI